MRRLVEKAQTIGTQWLFTSADVDPERIPDAVLEPERDVVPLRLETLSSAVAAISDAMVRAKQSSAAFQMRDLRRTVETMLAASGVNRDLRAQIQSHGLGGVQGRHYDQHDYWSEKTRALSAWAARLGRIERGEPEPGVTDLTQERQRRAAAGGA